MANDTRQWPTVVVWGSLLLSRSLIAADAISSIRLHTVPTFIGEGISFAPATLTSRMARLGEQIRFPTGHVTTEHLLER